MTKRLRLNPCDYLYYVHDRQVRKAGIGGGVGFLVIEASGHADPDRVKAAFAATLAAHPVVLAELHIGRILGHPAWHIPAEPEQAACQAVEKAYHFDDLRLEADWEAKLHGLLKSRFVPKWELFPSPQILLEHYSLPDDRTWYCLRWPHLLMDAGGGQWFLAELGNYSKESGETTGELPEGLAPDDQTLDPLGGASLWKRLRLCWKGLSHESEFKSLRIAAITPEPPPRVESQGMIWKSWPADMVRKMRSNAERFAPPGPASHARFLGACVIRSLHQIFEQRQITVDAYPISLPLSMTDTDDDSDAARAVSSRPMPGNYLVAPTLYGRRELVNDRAALGSDLLRQLEAFYAREGHLSQWAMIWLASKMRVWMYDWVYQRRIGIETLASGFSYYGQIPRPVRRICGTKVTNLWGTAPLSTPPGWNPIFNKHQGKLNLGFAYNRPAITDDLAHEFVSLIEQEIFGD